MPHIVSTKMQHGYRALPLAGMGIRFANYVIDSLVFIGLYYGSVFASAILLGFLAAAFRWDFIFEDEGSPVFGLLSMITYVLIHFLYYGICEAIFQRTLGKLITGTKVTAIDGSKPKFLRIMGRAAARLIPFDAFSYLGGPEGWHDTISKTRVVDKSFIYTGEQAGEIKEGVISVDKYAEPVPDFHKDDADGFEQNLPGNTNEF